MEKFDVALIQMYCGRSPEENVEHAMGMVNEAAIKGARVICLPELFRTRYFCRQQDTTQFDLAEPLHGETTKTFQKIATLNRVVVIVPIFERRTTGVYHNTAVVIDADGTIAGYYRKMHIPQDPGFEEKFYFTPGDRGVPVFETALGKIGVLICWDQWFFEPARIATLKGASVLFYPSAIGWLRGDHGPTQSEEQQDAWMAIHRSHAIGNGIYVAAVNRVEYEPPPGGGELGGIAFWGSSFLCDPFGVVVAEASKTLEKIVFGTVDLDRIGAIRRSWPFLRDRRVDAYDGLNERWLEEEGSK